MPDHARVRGAPSAPLQGAWNRFRANRPAWIAAMALVGMTLFVVTSGGFLAWGPNVLSESLYQPPSARHWLGTDAGGRDVLARVCAGARVSLVIGFAGALVSLVIGVTWGSIAGFVGGRIDGLLMRTVDVLYSMPSIVVVIVLVSAFRDPVRALLATVVGPSAEGGAGLVFLVIGLGAVSWLTMARMVRAQVMSVKGRPFVEAARALGAGPGHILVRHILPNTAGVVWVYLMLTVPAVVLGESFLSYLGLGIQPPQASLGSLIADGADQINPIHSQVWLLLGPGGMLVGFLIALSFVGDGLRDALDPRRGG